MAEKTRYSDAELEEFRAIINEKLELAQRDYELLKASLTGADGNDTDDTSPYVQSFGRRCQQPCPKKKRHAWLNVS